LEIFIVIFLIGTNEVRYQDRFTLPYTEAVILETLRLGNIAPMALPHTLEEEYTIDGEVRLVRYSTQFSVVSKFIVSGAVK